MKTKSVLIFILVCALAGLLAWALRHGSSSKKTLSLYIWAEYIAPETLQQFEKEFGVTVIQENYPSNEAMLAKLKAGAEGYDIVVPTDYIVPIMIEQGLLAPLDHTKIPNLSNLAPEDAHPTYDPEVKFVVPYLFGTTGIAFDSRVVTHPPQSWKEFFSADVLGGLDRRVSLLDDSREVLGAALRSMGHSLNSTDPELLNQARTLIEGIRPFIGRFDTMSYKEFMASGDLVMAHAYSGESLRLAKKNPAIKYIIPDEGGTIYTDNLAIPAKAPNKPLALEFINFIHRPEISARLATAMQYGTVNMAARKLIDQEDLLNPGLYPTPEVMAKLEHMIDLGTKAEAFEDAWVTFRAEDPSMDPDLEDADTPEVEGTDRVERSSQNTDAP